jgi:hypothetical protein
MQQSCHLSVSSTEHLHLQNAPPPTPLLHFLSPDPKPNTIVLRHASCIRSKISGESPHIFESFSRFNRISMPIGIESDKHCHLIFWFFLAFPSAMDFTTVKSEPAFFFDCTGKRVCCRTNDDVCPGGEVPCTCPECSVCTKENKGR